MGLFDRLYRDNSADKDILVDKKSALETSFRYSKIVKFDNQNIRQNKKVISWQ